MTTTSKLTRERSKRTNSSKLRAPRTKMGFRRPRRKARETNSGRSSRLSVRPGTPPSRTADRRSEASVTRTTPRLT